MKFITLVLSLILLLIIAGCTSVPDFGQQACTDSDSRTTYILDQNQEHLPGIVLVNKKDVGQITFPDSCKSEKGIMKLYEYYCQDNDWAVKIVECNCVEEEIQGHKLGYCKG